MAEPSNAVFLSYASQDAAAAQRICEALRAAGVEVWFDQSELRGGDAWDQQIRNEIRDCALFIPIISAHSQARLEGYFRREWRLAADRTHDMAEEKAFLVPVVIDETSEQDASVPGNFRDRQWTRLPAGETSPAFIERISRLLTPTAVLPRRENRSSTTPVRQGLDAPRHASDARSWTKKASLAIAVLAVFGVGYIALTKFASSNRAANGAQTAALTDASIPTSNAIPAKSVAVLPFADMSEKHDQEYFSDGLAEELLDLLAQVPDLRVPGRTSSFSFKGKSDDIQTIAQKLRVAYVLEGSVRKSGNTARVTVQLIRADNGYHVWSKSFDRDFTDIFKVQEEVATAVVEALKAKLGPTQAAPHRTSNTEAYNQFLLGRQFHDRGNLDDLRRAVEAYRHAVVLDPNYAAAYAALSMAELYLADATGDADGLKRAEVSAEKAVALAPEEADGYAARGYLRDDINWDWVGAQSDLEKALALDPGNSVVQGRYGNLLSKLGRLTDGNAAYRKAIDLDPLSTSSWMSLSFNFMYDRDFIAAGAGLRRTLEIQPDNIYALSGLGTLQLLEGKAVEALATFSSIKVEAFRLTSIAMAEHTLGHAQNSQQALDKAVATLADDSADQIAQAYAWRGEKDKAFEWLDRAYQRRDGGLSGIKIDPLLANLRTDPRFAALLRKMKLPE